MFYVLMPRLGHYPDAWGPYKLDEALKHMSTATILVEEVPTESVIQERTVTQKVSVYRVKP